MVPTPHQRSGELGGGGDTHQDDGDDGQHDVDALPQQDSGIVALQLDGLLLLLLLQLQLGHSRLTRLESLLEKDKERGFQDWRPFEVNQWNNDCVLERDYGTNT